MLRDSLYRFWSIVFVFLLVACKGEQPAENPAPEPSQEPEPTPSGDPTPAVEEVRFSEGFGPVFSFVDNSHLLHRFDEGLLIDIGSAAALKYVGGRWRGSHWQDSSEEGGSRHAWIDGVRGILRFPVRTTDVELELVTMMKGSSEGQRMDFFLNGEKIGNTRTGISSSWHVERFPLPAAHLRDGENQVRFHFAGSESVAGADGRTAGAFRWVRIQPVGGSETGIPAEFETDRSARTLRAPANGGYTAYVLLPEQSRLQLSISGTADVPSSVALTSDGAQTETIWSGTASDVSQRAEIDLSRWSNQFVRIDFYSAGEGGQVSWVDPVLVVADGEQREVADADRPKHIIVWLVDTLRTDHFPVYNPSTRVHAPNYAAFAEQCVTFTNATVQGNSSLPASASIHTSTYPPVHRLNSGDRRLSSDLTLIADPFHEASWETGLYSSNGYVTQSRGFGRRYDSYRNLIHEPGRADSEHLLPHVVEWLQGHPDDHSFLFVNTIDPHVPYDPPADILARYYPEPYSGRVRPRGTGELLDALGDEGLAGDDLRYILALYDGEITYSDQYFGVLLEELRTQNRLDDTLIVITSDHGEAFFEHGRGGHGSGVWEEVVDVPLMLCHARSLGGGLRIDTEVELVDLLPTVVELSNLEIPDSAQGGSLLPLILDQSAAYNRPGFSYHQDDIRGLRMGGWKLQHRGGNLDDVYNLADGVEDTNVAAAHPLIHRVLRDTMSFHLAFESEWRKSEWGLANNHDESFAVMLDARGW